MIAENTVLSFLEALGSQASAPGGGAGSAVAGALGSALLSMVCRLTIGKPELEPVRPDMERIVAKTDVMTRRFLLLADEDASAFSSVIEAYRLPKNSEAEIEARKAQIQAGYIKACEPPLAIARLCLEVLELAPELAEKGNPAAVSDVGVAVRTALAGIEGAVLNVQINLKSIKDKAYVSTTEAEVAVLVKQGREISDQVYASVLAKL
ncbi:MAG: cyclodeaminase/cyclohydrolase family protein [Solirubrobacterales bacterium]